MTRLFWNNSGTTNKGVVVAKYYTASKSQSQGREGWAVIFRHPVRLDGTGKPGRRVRRGLGTNDETLATQLVAELNEILQRPELWEPAARVGLQDQDPTLAELLKPLGYAAAQIGKNHLGDYVRYHRSSGLRSVFKRRESSSGLGRS